MDPLNFNFIKTYFLYAGIVIEINETGISTVRDFQNSELMNGKTDKHARKWKYHSQ